VRRIALGRAARAGAHTAFQPTQLSMWLVEAGSGHDTGWGHAGWGHAGWGRGAGMEV